MRQGAYAYLRVSGQEQLDGSGFDRQQEIIKRYARKNGFRLVQIFREEAVSGTEDETKRPAFQSKIRKVELPEGPKKIY